MEMTPVKYSKRLFRNCVRLHGVEAQISEIAIAFEVVGNQALAQRLLRVAQTLCDVARDLHDDHGGLVQYELWRAQESSDTILGAALAGVLAEKERQEDERFDTDG